MVLRLPDSWSNWNLEMLVFEERGKPEYPEKSLSEQGRQPTTNSTHIWRRRWELNPGHIGGRRVLSPRRHPRSPRELKLFTAISTCSRQFQFFHGNTHGIFRFAHHLSTSAADSGHQKSTRKIKSRYLMSIFKMKSGNQKAKVDSPTFMPVDSE